MKNRKHLVRIVFLAVGIGTGYYQLQRSIANNLPTKGGGKDLDGGDCSYLANMSTIRKLWISSILPA